MSIDMLAFTGFCLLCLPQFSIQNFELESEETFGDLLEMNTSFIDMNVFDVVKYKEPAIFLLRKYPKQYILYQLTSKDIMEAMYNKRQLRRSERDLTSTSASSRQGRLLLKMAAKQLKNLILWGGLLGGSSGTGTLSATNSFNVFGKTINAAFSLAYGDRVFVPPFGVPPFIPSPIVPPVPPFIPSPFIPPAGIPPVPPLSVATKSVSNIEPQFQGTIVDSNGGIQNRGQIQENHQTDSLSPFRSTTISTDKGLQTGQTQSNVNQLLGQYMEAEKLRQKQLTDAAHVRQDQTYSYITNVNQQWRQFLKQHNQVVDQFNNRIYFPVPKVSET